MLQQILSLSRRFKSVCLAPALLLCAACQREVLNPAGDVARQQRDIIYISTGLMLLIIVPVLILIVIFAWRYRKGRGGTYDPNFDHSTSLEPGHLVGAVVDHHRAWRADLVEHAFARSVPPARSHLGGPGSDRTRGQAASRPGCGDGLEVAVHLSRTGRGERQ
jgi:hypothetical protein